MKFLSNLAPRIFPARDSAAPTRLGRQAELSVNPRFVAIDPSIRPIATRSGESSNLVALAKSETGARPRDGDGSAAAGHWAY